MATTPYARGRQYEYRARDKLRDAGFVVTRCYASKGSFDLHATRASAAGAVSGGMPLSVTWLVQVKKDGRIDPAERVALVEDAERAGALPVLAWGQRPMKWHIVSREKGKAWPLTGFRLS